MSDGMTSLVLTAEQYDDIVYPAVARTPPTDVKQLHLAGRVLTKLETVGRRHEQRTVGCPHCGQGEGSIITYKFDSHAEQALSVTIELHPDERDFVEERVTDRVTKLQAWKGRAGLPVLEQLKESA